MGKITGTAGADVIEPVDSDDTIYGLGGGDILFGGGGNDVLYGGDGNDMLLGDGGADAMHGDAGDDAITIGYDPQELTGPEVYDGGAGTDTLSIYFSGPIDLSLSKLVSIETIEIVNDATLSMTASQLSSISILKGNSSDVTITTGGNVSLSGKSIQNIGSLYLAPMDTTINLAGLSGLEVHGNVGVDTLIGGAGPDALWGGGANDKIYGGAGDDLLYGEAGDDVLDGQTGMDYMYGGDGNDLIYAGNGYDYDIDGGSGIDTLSYVNSTTRVTLDLAYGSSVTGTGYASVYSFETIVGSGYGDDISGTSGNETLDGGKGDDYLAGAGGVDILNGGEGKDTVSFLTSYRGIAIDLGSSTAQVTGFGTVTLISVENVLGSSYNDLFIASRENNHFDGGDGGSDTVSYINAQSGVTADLNLTTGQRTGGSGTDSFSGISNLIGSSYGDHLFATNYWASTLSGGGGNDVLTGRTNDDTLYGGDGDDLLDGGGGNDLLNGGVGIDTASYATSQDAVIASLLSGTGAIWDSTDTLIGIENLTGSAFDDILIGDDNANALSGGNGNDTLIGGLGNDTLDGGAGIDTLSYADAASGITLSLVGSSYQNTGGAGIDVVRNVENIVGSAFNDTLTGSQYANVFTGGAGDDVLFGGLGNDTLYGGDGIDTASYATATGAIRANLTILTQQSTISAGSDTLSGIENLTGGAYDDQLTGDADNNVLTGNAGNDLLVGGLGDDTLNGGAGIDTASYANAAAGVTISLALTTAQDTGGAGIDTFLSIENVTGSAYDDVITGSAQVNVINGGTGNDTIDAGSSNDTVDGGYGNDLLKGAGGDDILIGNVGADTLTGGAGADTLTGGTQNDRFVYTALGDSTVAAADRITDFAKGDILDVSAIDASTKLGCGPINGLPRAPRM